MRDQTVFFFDGVCGLCDRTVDFILRHDARKKFKFVALQDEKAQTLLREGAQPPSDLSSFILLYRGRFFYKSEAYFVIIRELGFPWSLLYPLRFLPRVLRDGAYDLVAKNRYRIFGTLAACRVPTPEERDRFL